VSWKETQRRRKETLPLLSRVGPRARDAPVDDVRDCARSEDARSRQGEASFNDARAPLSLKDARSRQGEASFNDARAPLSLKDGRASQTDTRITGTMGLVGQRDASLRPVGPPLSFTCASFAPMLATVGVGGTPDDGLRQAQREAIARVNRRERSPRLERFVLSRGVSSFDAKDTVQSAVSSASRRGDGVERQVLCPVTLVQLREVARQVSRTRAGQA